jgi:hypothetical protein
MNEILVTDKYGRVVDRDEFARPRKAMPSLGNQYGAWAGRQEANFQMPGGQLMAFDLTKLTLTDFRAMRNNYQINASLAMLRFVLHQIDWKITSKNKEMAEVIEENLRATWTPLVNAISQAHWAGYSPTVMNFSNEIQKGYTVISDFKDLVPEECSVNWKKVEGWAPPGKTKPVLLEYDGIIQHAALAPRDGRQHLLNQAGYPIPAGNTIWYSLMMENGDYYGRKLLRAAFPAWFFSQLIHLFANRYFERFGEPTPVGRAPLSDVVTTDNGNKITGKQAMELIVNGLRNRGAVTLPNDRDAISGEYEWDIKYLESQMRGADFERYLSRLDEEMSIAIFTPMLLFRTGSTGSHSLGQDHMKVFLWMINALAGDMKTYIQRYVVDRLKEINFPGSDELVTWDYRRLGKDNEQVLGQLVQAMVQNRLAQPNLDELGTAIGLTMDEIEQLTTDPAAPGVDPLTGQPKPETDPNKKGSPDIKKTEPSPTVTARHPSSLQGVREVIARAVLRAEATHKNGRTGDFGHKNEFLLKLRDAGADESTAARIAKKFYEAIDGVMPDLHAAYGRYEYTEFRTALGNCAELLLDEAAG